MTRCLPDSPPSSLPLLIIRGQGCSTDISGCNRRGSFVYISGFALYVSTQDDNAAIIK